MQKPSSSSLRRELQCNGLTCFFLYPSKLTIETIESVGWSSLDWLAHSHDLNIIEQGWAWMKMRVSELQSQTMEDLS